MMCKDLHSLLCASFSFGEMLAFTLTAFLELMDHGIVSWDLISLSFIKQVPCPKKPRAIHLTHYSFTGQISTLKSFKVCIFIHILLFNYVTFLSSYIPDMSGCCCLATPHIVQSSFSVCDKFSSGNFGVAFTVTQGKTF